LNICEKCREEINDRYLELIYSSLLDIYLCSSCWCAWYDSKTIEIFKSAGGDVYDAELDEFTTSELAEKIWQMWCNDEMD
jgi:hypothetical protein